jgi:DNA-directed RNA polymerase specialized sigma24 family protein
MPTSTYVDARQSSTYVDGMTDPTNEHQPAATHPSATAHGGAPSDLEEVAVTARLMAELEVRQRRAVLRALDNHSWAEIGAALGVSKQAAHRKFVKDLAGELQTQVAGMKAAGRSGNAAEVRAEVTALKSTAALMRKRRGD